MALNVLHLVVGKTRTGKLIICATNFEGLEAARDHFDTPCFSADDLFDAFALFSYLLIRSARRKCDFAGLYEEHSFEIRLLMSLEEYCSSNTHYTFFANILGWRYGRIIFKAEALQ